MLEIAKIKRVYGYSGNFSIKILCFLSILIILILNGVVTNKKAPITSIFYQPLLKDKMDWNSIFKKLQKAHIETLILQWSKFGEVDFLKNRRWLEEILSNGQRYNIDVVVGLYGDDKYFKKIEDKKLNIKSYLRALREENIIQAKRVYSIAKDYSSFKGYYIYDEIDYINFKDKEKALKKYLKKLNKSIKEISNHQIYISAYFSKNISEVEYAKMLSNVISKDYILFLQSGIGANLVDNNRSSRYMKIFSKDFNSLFIPIVEAFSIKKSEIEPIDFNSLKRQIYIIKDSTESSNISLFSLRYFLDKKIFDKYIGEYTHN